MTPDDVSHVRDQAAANGGAVLGLQATVRKPGFAGTGNFRQKQQESHGAPL
jgi:hypothetical protein